MRPLPTRAFQRADHSRRGAGDGDCGSSYFPRASIPRHESLWQQQHYCWRALHEAAAALRRSRLRHERRPPPSWPSGPSGDGRASA